MMPYRVLFVHNRYLQRGGEDVEFEAEKRLMESRGHDVSTCIADNQELLAMPPHRILATAIWSRAGYARVRDAVRKFRPDIVHFHNTFAVISPASLWACENATGPRPAVVQSLHNYRIGCPAGPLCREGRACTTCLSKYFAWPAVLRACYHHSRSKSLAVAVMSTVHRCLRTWKGRVDAFIALTHFARALHIRTGLPSERIFVKPNFPGISGPAGAGGGGFALFVGRLAPEKGIQVLLDAWRRVGTQIPVLIAGNGPLAATVENCGIANVRYLGSKSSQDVFSLMQNAEFLVVPSTQVENFGLVLAEGFAAGCPSIASRIGALEELTSHRQTGLLFEPGNPTALAESVEWAVRHPEILRKMRLSARAEFEAKYTPERNYDMTMAIYGRALTRARAAA